MKFLHQITLVTCAARMILGGVPMSVPSPPIVPAYPIPKINAFSNFGNSFLQVVPFNAEATCAVIANPIGIIIITAAVLDTHMERKAVATMNPSKIRCVLVPMNAMMAIAILL